MPAVPSEKPWKTTREQVAAAVNRTIPDVCSQGLRVVFVGINPSLYSAAVGHHFARPGNRFWPALADAGFTPRLFSPFEDRRLVDHGCGITNLVPRATARAVELSPDELASGAQRLTTKLRRWHPEWVAFVGITAYRSAFDRPDAKLGPQTEPVGSTPAWVLPNPSGLNAHFQAPDFARLFGELQKRLYPTTQDNVNAGSFTISPPLSAD